MTHRAMPSRAPTQLPSRRLSRWWAVSPTPPHVENKAKQHRESDSVEDGVVEVKECGSAGSCGQRQRRGGDSHVPRRAGFRQQCAPYLSRARHASRRGFSLHTKAIASDYSGAPFVWMIPRPPHLGDESLKV
jgi:hypothetical protein